MNKPRVFLVVGHSNWGKSRTLRALTNGLDRWIRIDEKEFLVRRMSNDDVPKRNPTSYANFINGLVPSKVPLVIMAYCPEKSPSPFITALAKKYEVYSWVLEYKYDGTASIAASEVDALREFGTVQVYTPMHTESADRAKAFVQFVMANVG